MAAAARRRVVILAYDGVQALDVTGPHEVFFGASSVVGEPAPYAVDVLAVASGPGAVRERAADRRRPTRRALRSTR